MRGWGLEFMFEHLNKEGKVLWQSGWLPNQMSDEGFEQMYDIYFRGQATVPSGFELGLTTAAPSQDDDITDIEAIEVPDEGTDTEANGYARQTVERSNTGFPTLTLDAGDMQITSKTVEFENTHVAEEAWDAATHAFLSAVMAGADKFVCWRALSTTRTLEFGDKLRVTLKIKGEQPA